MLRPCTEGYTQEHYLDLVKPQTFSRKPGRKVAGGCPPPPHFYGPLVGARSFWRWCHIVPVVGGYFLRPMYVP